jgi:hypothetical protein
LYTTAKVITAVYRIVSTSLLLGFIARRSMARHKAKQQISRTGSKGRALRRYYDQEQE